MQTFTGSVVSILLYQVTFTDLQIETTSMGRLKEVGAILQFLSNKRTEGALAPLLFPNRSPQQIEPHLIVDSILHNPVYPGLGLGVL